MNTEQLLQQLSTQPETLDFSDFLALIDSEYDFQPTAFSNGDIENAAHQNQGSCKVFAFALLHGLNEAQTLALFGKFYREEVLLQPLAENHANIRQFIKHGFAGLRFHGKALKAKHD